MAKPSLSINFHRIHYVALIVLAAQFVRLLLIDDVVECLLTHHEDIVSTSQVQSSAACHQ
jgi:hypothetical protein